MIAPHRPTIGARERRVAKRLAARGLPGLGEALVRLRGAIVGSRWRIDELYAVGAEGAVFTTTNLGGGASPPAVVKIPLLPYHRSRDLTSSLLRHRRQALRDEARHLAKSGSSYMPSGFGLHEFTNPLLDRDRGGPFAEPDPALAMERLPGLDADLWLARIHRSGLPKAALREHLDGIAVGLLLGLRDLHERGYFYADLRPGNLRVAGRPLRRVRLLDAGGLVEVGDLSNRFPHVPHYLPPSLFDRRYMHGLEIQPTAGSVAIMAGRTLFEIATGTLPVPGRPLDHAALGDCGVSPVVADVIDGLGTGSFSSVVTALRYLTRRSDRHAAGAELESAAAPDPPALRFVAPPPPASVLAASGASAEPPARAPRGFLHRLLHLLARKPASGQAASEQA